VKSGFAAAIFDMDGVVTRTARLHAAAWKELFDDFLRQRAGEGVQFEPFDERSDYRAYVDGKPRREGVRSFLRARRVAFSEADEEALASRKNALFERRLEAQGVEIFASSIALIEALRARGVKTGVVTSSRHGREILQSAGIESLFDARLDGMDLEEQGLKGKPDPDMFLVAVKNVARARGMAQLAKDTGLGRESLYKALAPGAKPRYDTLLKVLRALGVKLHVEPVE